MPPRDPDEHRASGRLGGLRSAVRGRADPVAARAAMWQRWLARADAAANGVPLSDAERDSLAKELRRQHMAALSVRAHAKRARDGEA